MRWAGRAALALAGLLVALGVLEAVLRAWPQVLGAEFANGARSRYTTRAGGIYYADRNLRMVFMLPEHSTTMWANGYTWHHRTDRLGYRNKVLWVPADVVLLGDSLIYGHGVEVEDTVAWRLHEASGLKVANLGQQGDCAWQEAYRLTEALPVFRPRWAVYFFGPNDILDLYDFLSDEAMRAFIDTPVERITWPARTDPGVAIARRQERLRHRWIGKRIEEESYVFKMARWLRWQARTRGWARLPVAEAARTVPWAEVTLDPGSLGWRYTDKAVAYMDWVARRHGARLAAVSLADGRPYEILRQVAARHGVPFVEMAPLPPGVWLQRDPHLSPAGARHVAEAVARFLRRQEQPPPPAPPRRRRAPRVAGPGVL